MRRAALALSVLTWACSSPAPSLPGGVWLAEAPLTETRGQYLAWRFSADGGVKPSRSRGTWPFTHEPNAAWTLSDGVLEVGEARWALREAAADSLALALEDGGTWRWVRSQRCPRPRGLSRFAFSFPQSQLAAVVAQNREGAFVVVASDYRVDVSPDECDVEVRPLQAPVEGVPQAMAWLDDGGLVVDFSAGREEVLVELGPPAKTLTLPSGLTVQSLAAGGTLWVASQSSSGRGPLQVRWLREGVWHARQLAVQPSAWWLVKTERDEPGLLYADDVGRFLWLDAPGSPGAAATETDAFGGVVGPPAGLRDDGGLTALIRAPPRDTVLVFQPATTALLKDRAVVRLGSLVGAGRIILELPADGGLATRVTVPTELSPRNPQLFQSADGRLHLIGGDAWLVQEGR